MNQPLFPPKAVLIVAVAGLLIGGALCGFSRWYDDVEPPQKSAYTQFIDQQAANALAQP